MLNGDLGGGRAQRYRSDRVTVCPLASLTGCTSDAFSAPLKVCTTPCDTRNKARTKDSGIKNIQDAAGHIDPVIADGLRRMSDQAAYQGDQYRHTGGRGKKVMDPQSQHLGKVAHGGFAAVALPVGIGRETDGGVKGQVRTHGRQTLRIQRQELTGDVKKHTAEAVRPD